jgi:hypothetical protein
MLWPRAGTGPVVSDEEELDGKEYWRTKIRMIHVSTVCSDSGSNESRPIVVVPECKVEGQEEAGIEAG